MKRIFPVIIILIILSLFGLIYFQVLWLQTAKLTKEKQLRENIFIACTEAAEELIEKKTSLLPLSKKSDLLFSNNDQIKMEILRPSVIQRFSKDEIYLIIRKSLDKHLLDGIPFEFAVSDNSVSGDQIQSTNFLKYFLDSTHNTNVALPLEPAPGSDLENLVKEEYLVVIVPNQAAIVFREIFWFILGTVLFMIIIIAAFFITVRTLIRQKKLSEIKSDFINNMTHEFKTPIATISLAVDALKNEKVIADHEKKKYFIDIIKEENKRMNKQVELILQASLFDKKEIQLNNTLLSMHSIISTAINNTSLTLDQKKGKVQTTFNATSDMIFGDEVHITNVINNLLDNAIKYSKPEGLLIKISTKNTKNQLQIVIQDNGIGMTKDTMKNIFEKFYRAHTGNIHNVKGFGLGLSYVKSIVTAHKGSIKPESTFGVGSTFVITFPLAS